jgi:hypothetical protein
MKPFKELDNDFQQFCLALDLDANITYDKLTLPEKSRLHNEYYEIKLYKDYPFNVRDKCLAWYIYEWTKKKVKTCSD